ncbi:hypothetical protein O0I10_002207 [Lichtheimia ornata]|uniref:Cullin family profile domain-containing protein n=1 Tax=Lichtheimia ornata TaxID=688661 RepID=A0AAD7VBD1_9FUNG|nr:uncharacterized protein O0I10_002207 [Lichtheimia ornata]KAJ8661876.1 hypothetical protein O0I10_002207 [Lichtheimia ornata]
MFADDSRLPTLVDYDPSATHSPPQLATSSRLNGHGGLIIQPARMATTSSIPVLNVKNRREEISESCNQSGYLDAGWSNLHLQYLSCVLRGDRNIPVSLQSAYELCVNLCYNGDAQSLYQRIYNELENHYKELGSLLSSMAAANDDFLGYLRTMWEENNEKLEKIRSVFIELERRYIIKQTPYRSIRELGIHLFYVNIVEHHDLVKRRLILNVLFFFHQSRNNCNIPNDQIHSAIKMMQEMNIFTTGFEPCLIYDTELFYRNESTRIFSKLNVPGYLQFAARRRSFEESQQTGIPFTTKMHMSAIVIDKFIRSPLKDILAKGYYMMLDSNDVSSLVMLYTTITEQQKQLLRIELVEYIKTRFRSKTEEYKNEMKTISFIYKFKAKLEHLVTNAFEKDVMLTQAIADTFEGLIQGREPAIAIAAAEFIDKKMKSQKLFQNANNDSNLPDVFDGALTIFRSLADKDVFEGVYQRLLGSRLLSGASNTRAEKLMVIKLQSICGNDYMTQFTKMITDIDEWSDFDARYNAQVKIDTRFDFQVRTVSNEAWSFAGTHSIHLGNELQRYLTQYEAAFSAHHKSRKVLWSHSLSTLVMDANLRFGTTQLIVNALQASVLLLFNRDKEMWEFDEIAHETKISDDQLKDVLRTMTCCPGALLQKDSPDPEYIWEQDTFSCNLNFRHSSTIDLYLAFSMEGKKGIDPAKKQLPRLGDDRKYKIDATIVRIMKQQGQFKHPELYESVSTQLPFTISAKEFKESVESLIDRGMMKRQRSKTNLYVYLP